LLQTVAVIGNILLLLRMLIIPYILIIDLWQVLVELLLRVT